MWQKSRFAVDSGGDGGPVLTLPCSTGRPVITRQMKGPAPMPSAGTTEHLREQRQHSAIEPIAMRVPEACRYLGIGRSTLYVLIGQGKVEIVKLGSSTLVLTQSLRALVEQRRQCAGDRPSDVTE